MSKPNHFPRSLRKAGTILSAILLGASLIPSASAEDGVAVTGLVDLGLMVQHANGRTNTTMESGNNHRHPGDGNHQRRPLGARGILRLLHARYRHAL